MQPHELRQQVGRGDAVRVDHGDQRSARLADRGVPRRAREGSLPETDQTNAGKALGDDLRRTVVGAVGDDHLIRERRVLGRDRFETSFDGLRAVVYGDHNGDMRIPLEGGLLC